MEKIKVIRAYNFINEDGDKLQLQLGRYTNTECIPYHGDMGFRWAFNGKKIPMPVRASTWFNGFPENIMLDWLKGNGWALRSCVDMNTSRATVCELPFIDNTRKGNTNIGERVFHSVIRELVASGRRLSASHLYRYANGGTLSDAEEAVREICG